MKNFKDDLLLYSELIEIIIQPSGSIPLIRIIKLFLGLRFSKLERQKLWSKTNMFLSVLIEAKMLIFSHFETDLNQAIEQKKSIATNSSASLPTRLLKTELPHITLKTFYRHSTNQKFKRDKIHARL